MSIVKKSFREDNFYSMVWKSRFLIGEMEKRKGWIFFFFKKLGNEWNGII